MDTQWPVVFGSLIGALLGAAIGAWIQGRWTEKGRLSAIRSVFEEILQQSKQKAKAQEEGKRLATHEDIDNVLREVRLTTKEMEQVRTDIQNSVWEKQNTWNLKRDMYIRLLTALGKTFSSGNAAASMYRLAEQYDAKGQQVPDLAMQQTKEVDDAIWENQREVSQILATSGIVISPEATVAVVQAFSRWAVADSLNSSNAFEQFRSDVDLAIKKVQQVARKDLRIQRRA